MVLVEQRFKHNIGVAIGRATQAVTLHAHKGFSDREMMKLLAEGKYGYFDFVYIDGSHQASDVLSDAVLGFKLLRPHGIMIFDDYLWSENLPGGVDPLRCPKPAIDAFTNIYARKLIVISAPLYQLFVEKISD